MLPDIYNNPLIHYAADSFGRQAVVVQLNCFEVNNTIQVANSGYPSSNSISLKEAFRIISKLPIGELILHSIDNEGLLNGFNQKLYSSSILNSLTVPLVASGGASKSKDFLDILQTSQSRITGIIASSAFHFTALTPLEVSKYLIDNGYPARIPIA